MGNKRPDATRAGAQLSDPPPPQKTRQSVRLQSSSSKTANNSDENNGGRDPPAATKQRSTRKAKDTHAQPIENSTVIDNSQQVAESERTQSTGKGGKDKKKKGATNAKETKSVAQTVKPAKPSGNSSVSQPKAKMSARSETDTDSSDNPEEQPEGKSDSSSSEGEEEITEEQFQNERPKITSDKTSSKVGKKQPASNDAKFLFDDQDEEDDVEMTSATSDRGSSHGISRGNSRGSQSLPSRSSESIDDGYSRDDDNGMEEVPVAKTSRSNKRSRALETSSDEEEQSSQSKKRATGRRQAAFLNEKPTIERPNIVKPSKGKARVSSSINTMWAEHAQLVPPPPDKKDYRLNDQNQYIRLVLNTAIRIETHKLFIEDAFPEIKRRALYCRKFLVDACNENVMTVTPIDNITERLRVDLDFCQELGAMVLDRLPSVRSPAKGTAAKEVAAYELGIGDKCKARVESLFDKHQYVFPGEWNDLIWSPQRKSPYLHPALINTIKTAFFMSSQAVGYRVIQEYQKTSDASLKPELPLPLIALAATGLYAALYEWKTGRFSGCAFDGNVFLTTYRDHLASLEGMKKSPARFHAIMANLYEAVIGSSRSSSSIRDPSQSALSIMDLSED